MDGTDGGAAAKIKENIFIIREKLRAAAEASGRDGGEITLLAATKAREPGEIRAAFDAGVRAAGENRVQELLSKDARGAYAGMALHFIGPLQSNKAKYLVGRVGLIESVDSLRLARIISGLALRRGVVQNVLAEINIGGEESKSGVAPEDAPGFCRELFSLPGLSLRGLMAVPPREGGDKYFEKMRELFDALRAGAPDGFDILSMGMSADFEAAVRAGATMVRIGEGIFGPRRPAPDGLFPGGGR